MATPCRAQVEATIRRRTGSSTNRPRGRDVETDRRGARKDVPGLPSLANCPLGDRGRWGERLCDTDGVDPFLSTLVRLLA